MDRFVKEVLQTVRKYDMLGRGQRDGAKKPVRVPLVVGFSGGADSLCLLEVLWELRALLSIEPAAVHVNHGLRAEEAQRDEAFCRAFAAERGIAFRAVHVDVGTYARENGMSTEEAGRVLRYRALREEAERLGRLFVCTEDVHRAAKQWMNGTNGTFDVDRNAVSAASAAPAVPQAVRIAVAHHADDQAETILLNLLRGSGLRGLRGMEAVRGELIRPLIFTARENIEAFLKARGLRYVTDSTNLSSDYTRNRVRREVLPLLRDAVNANAVGHILKAGELCGEADAYFAEEARNLLARCAVCSGEEIALKRKELKEKPQIIRRYVIIEALTRLGAPQKDFGARHFEALEHALCGPKGTHLDLPNGVSADTTYDELYICKRRTSCLTESHH